MMLLGFLNLVPNYARTTICNYLRCIKGKSRTIRGEHILLERDLSSFTVSIQSSTDLWMVPPSRPACWTHWFVNHPFSEAVAVDV